ncbi:MAG: hypothetical protein WAR37_01100 [Candidatus Microsaccharimonas sp.]
MKKTFAIIFTIMSAVLILDSVNASHAIAMFLLAGIIPGTDATISASQMLELFAFLLGFTLSRIAIWVTSLLLSTKTRQLELISSQT